MLGAALAGREALAQQLARSAMRDMEIELRRQEKTHLQALRARADHLERLRIAVTERNLSWSEDLIEGIDNDTLFFDSPEAVAEAIVERVSG